MGFSWLEKAFLASAVFVGLTSGIQAQQGWNPEQPDTPIGDDSSLVEMVEPEDSMEADGIEAEETKKALDPDTLQRDPPINKGLNDFGDFVKEGLDERKKAKESVEKALPKDKRTEVSDRPPQLATPSQSGAQIPQTSTGKDPNSHFDGKYHLKPNVNYEANGANYETNSAGGIKSWSATLTGQEAPSKYEYSYHKNLDGKSQEQDVYDDAGHLVAREHGGSGKSDNLVAMEKHVNRRDYRAFERENNRLLQDGYTVRLQGENIMPDNATRPQAIMVSREILDKNGNVVGTDHFSWTNLNMAEYQDNDFGFDEIPNAMDETLQNNGISREEIEGMESRPVRGETTLNNSEAIEQEKITSTEENNEFTTSLTNSEAEKGNAQNIGYADQDISSSNEESGVSLGSLEHDQQMQAPLTDTANQKLIGTTPAPEQLEAPEEKKLLTGETLEQKKLTAPEEELPQSSENSDVLLSSGQGDTPSPALNDNIDHTAPKGTQEAKKTENSSHRATEDNGENLGLRQGYQAKQQEDNLQENKETPWLRNGQGKEEGVVQENEGAEWQKNNATQGSKDEQKNVDTTPTEETGYSEKTSREPWKRDSSKSGNGPEPGSKPEKVRSQSAEEPKQLEISKDSVEQEADRGGYTQ